MCVQGECESEPVQRSICRVTGGVGKKVRGKWGSWTGDVQTRFFVHLQAAPDSRFVTLGELVCKHLVPNEQQVSSHKPRVETCNPDRFTRMCPQIYGCVSVCTGVSVFCTEMLCVTQDKCVFVSAGVHKTRSAS